MKTTFYLNGKKTTRKAVTELISAERLERYIKKAYEDLDIGFEIEKVLLPALKRSLYRERDFGW